MLNNLPEGGTVDSLVQAEFWNMARLSSGSVGVAMTTAGHTIEAGISEFKGLSACEAASAVTSWNLEEASAAMAVINACYNTIERLERLQCYEPYENYCTEGLDLAGKTIGLIGHLTMPKDVVRLAKDVFILERNPQPGDYPDSACEYLLPRCDVVLITGSSIINKTLPRLLELSRNAYTILTGPTVPMCPELLNLGIQRLAGMAVSDSGIEKHVRDGISGSPYPYGTTFLLKE